MNLLVLTLKVFRIFGILLSLTNDYLVQLNSVTCGTFPKIILI